MNSYSTRTSLRRKRSDAESPVGPAKKPTPIRDEVTVIDLDQPDSSVKKSSFVQATPKSTRLRGRRRGLKSVTEEKIEPSEGVDPSKEPQETPKRETSPNTSFSPFACSQIQSTQDCEVFWDGNSPGFSKQDLKNNCDKSGFSTPSPIVPAPNRILFNRFRPSERLPLGSLNTQRNSESLASQLGDLLSKVNEKRYAQSTELECPLDQAHFSQPFDIDDVDKNASVIEEKSSFERFNDVFSEDFAINDDCDSKDLQKCKNLDPKPHGLGNVDGNEARKLRGRTTQPVGTSTPVHRATVRNDVLSNKKFQRSCSTTPKENLTSSFSDDDLFTDSFLVATQVVEDALYDKEKGKFRSPSNIIIDKNYSPLSKICRKKPTIISGLGMASPIQSSFVQNDSLSSKNQSLPRNKVIDKPKTDLKYTSSSPVLKKVETPSPLTLKTSEVNKTTNSFQSLPKVTKGRSTFQLGISKLNKPNFSKSPTFGSVKISTKDKICLKPLSATSSNTSFNDSTSFKSEKSKILNLSSKSKSENYNSKTTRFKRNLSSDFSQKKIEEESEMDDDDEFLMALMPQLDELEAQHSQMPKSDKNSSLKTDFRSLTNTSVNVKKHSEHNPNSTGDLKGQAKVKEQLIPNKPSRNITNERHGATCNSNSKFSTGISTVGRTSTTFTNSLVSISSLNQNTEKLKPCGNTTSAINSKNIVSGSSIVPNRSNLNTHSLQVDQFNKPKTKTLQLDSVKTSLGKSTIVEDRDSNKFDVPSSNVKLSQPDCDEDDDDDFFIQDDVLELLDFVESQHVSSQNSITDISEKPGSKQSSTATCQSNGVLTSSERVIPTSMSVACNYLSSTNTKPVDSLRSSSIGSGSVLSCAKSSIGSINHSKTGSGSIYHPKTSTSSLNHLKTSSGSIILPQTASSALHLTKANFGSLNLPKTSSSSHNLPKAASSSLNNPKSISGSLNLSKTNSSSINHPKTSPTSRNLYKSSLDSLFPSKTSSGPTISCSSTTESNIPKRTSYGVCTNSDKIDSSLGFISNKTFNSSSKDVKSIDNSKNTNFSFKSSSNNTGKDVEGKSYIGRSNCVPPVTDSNEKIKPKSLEDELKKVGNTAERISRILTKNSKNNFSPISKTPKLEKSVGEVPKNINLGNQTKFSDSKKESKIEMDLEDSLDEIFRDMDENNSDLTKFTGIPTSSHQVKSNSFKTSGSKDTFNNISVPFKNSSTSLPKKSTGNSVPFKDSSISLPKKSTGNSVPFKDLSTSLPKESNGNSVPFNPFKEVKSPSCGSRGSMLRRNKKGLSK